LAADENRFRLTGFDFLNVKLIWRVSISDCKKFNVEAHFMQGIYQAYPERVWFPDGYEGTNRYPARCIFIVNRQ
jgi:hypothetical protein